jgi:hypothetical protein
MDTMDLGLWALASDHGAAASMAVMGAMVVGGAAVGAAQAFNRWGETPEQEAARVAAEARWDAKPRRASKPRASASTEPDPWGGQWVPMCGPSAAPVRGTMDDDDYQEALIAHRRALLERR